MKHCWRAESGSRSVELGPWASVRVVDGPDGLHPTELHVHAAEAPPAWAELVGSANGSLRLHWTVTLRDQLIADRFFTARSAGPDHFLVDGL